MSKFVLALCLLAPLCKADLLLGTITWPMSGTSDSPPPETCQFGFAVQGLAFPDEIPANTTCGVVDHTTFDVHFDAIAARLTNGIDNTIFFTAALSLSASTNVSVLESAIPKAPGIAGPDFAGFSITRLVPSGEITESHIENCGQFGCIGPWEFQGTGHWSIYGNPVVKTATPEGTPYLAMIPVLAIAMYRKIKTCLPHRRA